MFTSTIFQISNRQIITKLLKIVGTTNENKKNILNRNTQWENIKNKK